MEQVRQIISEIETKIHKMRTSMENIQAENATLRTEIENLAGKLKQREMEAREFREKYDELVQRNEQFAQPLSHDNKEHNERIDALVREIDDCISRLK